MEERRKLRQAVQARVEYNPEEDDAVKVIRYLKSYRAKQLLEKMVSEMDLTVLDQADPDEHALIQLAESIRVNDEPTKTTPKPGAATRLKAIQAEAEPDEARDTASPPPMATKTYPSKTPTVRIAPPVRIAARSDTRSDTNTVTTTDPAFANLSTA